MSSKNFPQVCFALVGRIPGWAILPALAVITLILWLTHDTTQQIVFILFGAPVIYGALAYGSRGGLAVAVYAAVSVTLARWPCLVSDYYAHRWTDLFFEGLFVPFFYLAFCLFLAWLICSEQDLNRHCQALVRDLQAARQNNLELFAGLLRGLLAAVEAKDTYTKGHSERVARHALAIGQALGLSPEELRALFCAAILHDIGKIAIPCEVLRKPGPLDDEQYALVKTHAARGAEMLEGIPGLTEIVPVIYHHHEWYDGRGYPDGIAGEQIPLASRIIAVADAYDAMVSERPYRPPLGPHAAVDELKRASGTQFDPAVVAAFLNSSSWKGREPAGLPNLLDFLRVA